MQKAHVDSFSVAGINDHPVYGLPFDLAAGGDKRFVLSNSGHIPGAIQSAGNPKNFVENLKLSSDPRAWYYDASHIEGSWCTAA